MQLILAVGNYSCIIAYNEIYRKKKCYGCWGRAHNMSSILWSSRQRDIMVGFIFWGINKPSGKTYMSRAEDDASCQVIECW